MTLRFPDLTVDSLQAHPLVWASMKKTRLVRRPSASRLAARLGKGYGKKPSDALKDAHPVAKATYLWAILSEQLLDVLGPEVHHQWFRNVRAVVITDNTLLLETPNHFAAQWIHRHYQELVDVLLSVHDKHLSALFMSHKDRSGL
jgi:hypothetical protein